MNSGGTMRVVTRRGSRVVRSVSLLSRWAVFSGEPKWGSEPLSFFEQGEAALRRGGVCFISIAILSLAYRCSAFEVGLYMSLRSTRYGVGFCSFF